MDQRDPTGVGTGPVSGVSLRRAVRRELRVLPYLVVWVLFFVFAYDLVEAAFAGIVVWCVAAGVREWRHAQTMAARRGEVSPARVGRRDSMQARTHASGEGDLT